MTEESEMVWTEAEAKEINRDMGEMVLAAIMDGMKDLGIPRGTYSDDQFWNMCAMFHRRGLLVDAVIAWNTSESPDRNQALEQAIKDYLLWLHGDILAKMRKD